MGRRNDAVQRDHLVAELVRLGNALDSICGVATRPVPARAQDSEPAFEVKAFDGLLRDVLWEVKGHAWTYATIYKNPIMAKRILEALVEELRKELEIAIRCKRRFKVGVCDEGLLDALADAAPELDVEVISC